MTQSNPVSAISSTSCVVRAGLRTIFSPRNVQRGGTPILDVLATWQSHDLMNVPCDEARHLMNSLRRCAGLRVVRSISDEAAAMVELLRKLSRTNIRNPQIVEASHGRGQYPQISTIEQFVTFADRYTRIISPLYPEDAKGYIGGALSQVFPVGGSSNTKMSLGRTKTLFERAKALTSASQERFVQSQKAMLGQRILFMPIGLFHQGVSAAHTAQDIESILNAMRVALQAAR